MSHMGELTVLLVPSSDIRLLLVRDGAERDAVVEQARVASVCAHNLFVESKMTKREIPALFLAANMTLQSVQRPARNERLRRYQFY